jgi:5-methylcytosine-specific restriction protein A
MKTLKPSIATLGTTSTVRGWKPDSQRGNRHQRGYGYAWEKARERIKQRANGLCEPHLAQGLVHVGNECDHIVPKAKGGTDHDSNLQWCCTAFHREKTAREDSNHGGGA